MDHSLDRKTALGLFAGLSAVYWLGRAAVFGPGDSPEHAMSALVWGVSKAPGYPLYTAAAHLFSWIAPGTRAAAVNGFSGVLHAYAVALFFLLLRRQGAGRAAALTAAGLLAFGRLFWFYSGVAEVRALNDLLALAGAMAALTWSDSGARASLVVFAVCAGLGASHHPTFVLALPALAWLAATGRRRPGVKDAALFAAVALAACAAPYALLWARLQVSDPPFNFEGVRTAREVLALLLRESTGGPLKMFPGSGALGFTGFSWAKLALHAQWFGAALAVEAGPAGLALVPLGIWSAWRCGRRWLVFWGLWAAGAASYFLLVSSQTFPVHDEGYARAVLARFYLLPLIGVLAPAAFGAQWLADRARPGVVWALCAAAALGPALLRPMGHRARAPLRDYALQLIESSGPSDMLILVADDSLFAARYLDVVERLMEDRVVLVPGFFGSRRYRETLARRHPALVLPPAGPAGLPVDWKLWLELNPKRRLLTEGVLLADAWTLFPKAQPRGVLIELTDRPRSRAQTLAEARRFLALVERSAVGRSGAREFTQELFVMRAYRQMALFYGARVGSQDAALSRRLQLVYLSLRGPV